MNNFLNKVKPTLNLSIFYANLMGKSKRSFLNSSQGLPDYQLEVIAILEK